MVFTVSSRLNHVAGLDEFLGRDLSRLDVASTSWTKDDQQSGEHVPGGSSRAVHGQLHLLARLWLVQLPCCWQDVPVHHTRHSADRQLDRHYRRQRLGLVQQQIHGPCLNAIASSLAFSYNWQSYLICTMRLKTIHLTFNHNFGRHRPIYKTGLLSDSCIRYSRLTSGQQPWRTERRRREGKTLLYYTECQHLLLLSASLLIHCMTVYVTARTVC